MSDLRRRGDLGRDGVHRLLRELRHYGYLRREQIRDARGRLVGYDYTVFEVPGAPGPDSPDPAAPEPARPTLPSNQGTKNSLQLLPTTTTTSTATAATTSRRDGDDDDGRIEDGGHETNGGAGEDDGVVVERRDDDDQICADRPPNAVDAVARAEDPGIDFPGAMSGPEIAEAGRWLAGLPIELAQQVLDELAGRMATGVIRGSPLSYLRGLVARAERGTFNPELALAVVALREQRSHSEAVLQGVPQPPERPPADESDPPTGRALEPHDRAGAQATKRRRDGR